MTVYQIEPRADGATGWQVELDGAVIGFVVDDGSADCFVGCEMH